MNAGRPNFPMAPRPFPSQRITLIRSSMMFVTSICLCYWVGTRVGSLAALLVLALLWLGGFLTLVEHAFRFVSATTEETDFQDMLRKADIMHQPKNEKISENGENDWLCYGSSCMQGWRRSMEDDHVIILSNEGGFFGVFDGHSGASVAQFCGNNLFEFISRTRAYEEKNFSKALYDGFIAIDRHLHTHFSEEKSGCTAVVLLVTEDELYCGNAGDSRCVLCRDGESMPLSSDHKPFLPGEQKRIERAGGYVWNRRVNGVLALSRAIGDFVFKGNTQVPWDQQAVTSAPEVRYTRINRERDEFVVIACDGIWDVMNNNQVVDFVRQRLQRGLPVHKIAEELIERCLSPHPFGLGCDNMSVIILQFKRPNPLPSVQETKTDEDQLSIANAPQKPLALIETENDEELKVDGTQPLVSSSVETSFDSDAFPPPLYAISGSYSPLSSERSPKWYSPKFAQAGNAFTDLANAIGSTADSKSKQE